MGPEQRRRGHGRRRRGGACAGQPRRGPADRRPVRRAARSRRRHRLLHPRRRRRVGSGRGRRQRALRDGADGRHDGHPHTVLRRLLYGRSPRRDPPVGDPGLQPRRPRLPAALAGGHHGVRDRPGRGHRLQDRDPGRTGRDPHRRPADGARRPAPRLAVGAARGRPGPRPAHRVERRGPAAVPAAGRAGSVAGQHHRAQPARKPTGHREFPRTRRRGAGHGRPHAGRHRPVARTRLRHRDDRPVVCGRPQRRGRAWTATAGRRRPRALRICLRPKAFRCPPVPTGRRAPGCTTSAPGAPSRGRTRRSAIRSSPRTAKRGSRA